MSARERIEVACDSECKRRDRALSDLALRTDVAGAAAALRYSASWLIADKLAAALDGADGAPDGLSELDIIERELSRIDDRLATAESELATATAGSDAAAALAVEVAIFGEVSDRLELVMSEAHDDDEPVRGTAVTPMPVEDATDFMGRG
jgi:hypothetical protein